MAKGIRNAGFLGGMFDTWGQTTNLFTGTAPRLTRYLRTDATTATQQAEWAVIDAWEGEVGPLWLTGPEIQTTVAALATPSARVVLDDTAVTGTYDRGTITVPHTVRMIVIIHEVAHHLARPTGGEYHDPAWVQTYLQLIARVFGAALADRFRRSFKEHGVAA